MERNVGNNRGFSLIELLIAVFLISISMLALLSSMLLSIRTNVDNELRNASIRLANQTVEALLALPATSAELASSATHTRFLGDTAQNNAGLPVPRQTIRNFQQDFTITWRVTQLTLDVVQIDLTVGYLYRGTTKSHFSVVYKHKAI